MTGANLWPRAGELGAGALERNVPLLNSLLPSDSLAHWPVMDTEMDGHVTRSRTYTHVQNRGSLTVQLLSHSKSYRLHPLFRLEQSLFCPMKDSGRKKERIPWKWNRYRLRNDCYFFPSICISSREAINWKQFAILEAIRTSRVSRCLIGCSGQLSYLWALIG